MRTVGELRAALVATVGRQPGPTLWIAMGADEETLAADPEEPMALLGREQSGGSGQDRERRMRLRPPGDRGDGTEGARAPTPAEEQQLIERTARALTMPVDLARTRLELPSAIVARVEAAIVYPTDDGLAAVAGGILDLGMALQDVSLWESTVFALTRGAAVDHIGS